MEQELKTQAYRPDLRQNPPVKPRTDLPPVDIYCIRAVRFYQTLIKLETKPFVTSLYKIDQIIKDKEIEAIQKEAAQDEQTSKEMIDNKLLS